MLDAPPVQIDVPALVKHDLAAARRRTGAPILLPSKAPVTGDAAAVHGSGYGRRTHWAFTFFYGTTCGADACFIGDIEGHRGRRPAFRTKVRLRGGRTGYYKPLSCGGSCSPPEIQWISRGVLYSIQWGEAAGRRAMVSLANSALAAGPR